ncbi:MAG: thiamine kinase [Actinomycetota bacterium]|nr:thiamine kinase [Actinomycetota bacterium]
MRGYASDAAPGCTSQRITAVSRFTSGERHTVFKVSYAVPAGVRDVVVRVARSDEARDPHRAEREAVVLRKLQGRGGPLLLDFRRHSRWFDAPVSCTQFVPGEQRELAGASPEDVELLGAVVGSVHALPLDDLIPWFPETVPSTYLASRLDLINSRVATHVRDPLPTAVQADAARALRLTMDTLPDGPAAEAAQVLQHGDVATGNILWGTGPVLIDWEYTRLGDPADEIAYLFSQNGLAGAQREAFWRGYQEVTGGAVDQVAARVTWWEPVTLLGSAMWWLEEWSRRQQPVSHARGREDEPPSGHYLEQATRRLDGVLALFSARRG